MRTRRALRATASFTSRTLCLVFLALAAVCTVAELQLCCTYELATPLVNASHLTPGTVFQAARYRPPSCSDAALCRGEDVQLTDSGTALTLRLALPARCAPASRSQLEEMGDLHSPTVQELLPAGRWLHMSGDSLLRGVFNTMVTFVGQHRWEQWQGEAHFKSVFHQGRSMCCTRLADAGSCTYALHSEGAASLYDRARAGVTAGGTCVTYSFKMEYPAILEEMAMIKEHAAAGMPARLVTAAALHTMKSADAATFGTQVGLFLREAASPAWRETLVAIHAAAAPNYTAIAAGKYPQTEPVVSAFNAALRREVAAQARPGLRIVDAYGVTAAPGAERLFPRIDEVHFHDHFYQARGWLEQRTLS